MRRRLNLKDASGASAMEFAMIAPPLFLLIAGCVQLGWMLHCAATVRYSLETCARNLIFNPAESADTLKQAMVAKLAGKARADDLTVTIVQDASNPAQKMLVATSVFRTTLVVPWTQSSPFTFTARTRVPTT